MGLPGSLNGKGSACNAGDLGSITGSGRSPGEGHGNLPTSVFLPGEFHRQRSLMGYSLEGGKEVDTTEHLSLSLSLHRFYTHNTWYVVGTHMLVVM